MLYSTKATTKIVYQRIECNLLLLDISIRTLWIRSSMGAINVAGTVYHSQTPGFAADLKFFSIVLSVLQFAEQTTQSRKAVIQYFIFFFKFQSINQIASRCFINHSISFEMN